MMIRALSHFHVSSHRIQTCIQMKLSYCVYTKTMYTSITCEVPGYKTKSTATLKQAGLLPLTHMFKVGLSISRGRRVLTFRGAMSIIACLSDGPQMQGSLKAGFFFDDAGKEEDSKAFFKKQAVETGDGQGTSENWYEIARCRLHLLPFVRSMLLMKQATLCTGTMNVAHAFITTIACNVIPH